MRWPTPLRPATFLQRDNRFRALVELDGLPTAAHVPNSGRLQELFVPGRRVWVRPVPPGSPRKTSCDLILVEHADTLVSVDARLPNQLFREAALGQRLPGFGPVTELTPEVTVGASRLDFALTDADGRRCWVEVKSVTLVEEGVGLFPDAPTVRGVRHLAELVELRRRGDRAAAGFVIQRSDAASFAPHPTAHPAFADALRQASAGGVEIFAWRCLVSLKEIVLVGRIPVRLERET